MSTSPVEDDFNGRTGSDKLFPGKLHDMLDYAEKEGLDHIVSWTSDGTAFTIHKPKEVISILPMFFGHTKYRSFHRQLNMWSYRRVVDGSHKGSFSHPYFIKGQKALCRTISRQQFRSIPPESIGLSTDGPAPTQTASQFTQKITGMKRNLSQVSIESTDGKPKKKSSNQTFLRDGDVATFEGMTFHIVWSDLDFL